MGSGTLGARDSATALDAGCLRPIPMNDIDGQSDTPDQQQRQHFSQRALGTYATNVGVAALSLVSVLITSWLLGARGRGDIAFWTTTAYLAGQVGALGIGPAASVLGGRHPEQTDRIASTAIVMSVMLGTVAATGAALLVAVVSPEAAGAISLPIKVALASSIPLLIVHVALQQLAQAQYRFAVTNSAWLLPPLVNVVVNLGLAAIDRLTVSAAVLAWVIGQVLAGLLLLVTVARDYGLGRPSRRLADELIRFGLQSHIARVLLIGNYRLDQWILGALAGSEALGVYSVAVAWSEGLFFLPTALASVQRPDLVRLSARRAGQLAASVFRAGVLLTIPLAVGLVLVAPLITGGLFGAEFAGAAWQTRVLVIGAFGVAAMKLIGNALTAQRRPLLESAAAGLSFVTMVALDLLLVPRYGGDGAAVASAAAYLSGGALAIHLFCRHLNVAPRQLVPGRADISRIRSLVSAARDRTGRLGQTDLGGHDQSDAAQQPDSVTQMLGGEGPDDPRYEGHGVGRGSESSHEGGSKVERNQSEQRTTGPGS